MQGIFADAVRTSRVPAGAGLVGRWVVVVALVASVMAPSAAHALWKPTVSQVFSEQAASQRMITALVDNEIASLYIGASHRHGSSIMHASVLARMRDGNRVSGTLSMRRYRYKWYFYTISAGAAQGVSAVSVPAGISSAAVASCVSRQSANQWFASGIRYSRYHQLDVLSVSKNWSTATVQFRLSHNGHKVRDARMTCISQTSTAGKQYWFMTALK